MSALYCWGSSQDGALGVGTINEEKVLQPKEVVDFGLKDIIEISCGEKHTLIVVKDGSIYSCGNNDHGQLGHDKTRSKPEQIDNLSNMTVTQACTGTCHSLALTSAGEVFSWGDNSKGQLGRGQIETSLWKTPKLIKGLVLHTIVQITSGNYHCLALSSEALVYSWGSNTYGQLGQGIKVDYCNTVMPIVCLRGIPIAQVIAGGFHSLILSKSGAVFGWGKNCYGQLGLNDEQDRNHPTLCKSLRTQKVKYISCGEGHTLALTQDGGVFSFGEGSHGQLGHNSSNNEILPKKVMELMGSVVTQVVCGRKHSLTFSPDSCKVYSFGMGGNGQLGLGNTTSKNTPFPVEAPFIPRNRNRASAMMDHDGSFLTVKRIYAGGDRCFVHAFQSKGEIVADDFRGVPPEKQMAYLTVDLIDQIYNLPSDAMPPHEFSDELVKIFSTASCLNASFLLPNDEHYCCSSKKHGLNLNEVRYCMNRIGQAKNIVIKQKITQAIESTLLPALPPSPPDVEALRLYIILPEFHLFEEPKYYSSLIGPFAMCILRLDRPASRVLDRWWATLEPEFFRKLVFIYKQTVVYLLQLPETSTDQETQTRFNVLKYSMEMLKKLNGVSEQNGQIIPYNHFYIPEIKDKVNIKADYVNWVHQNRIMGSPPLSFCNYPFVFDAPAKCTLLQTDALMQMQAAFEEVQRRNLQSLFLPIDPVNPCLVLYVSRDNIVGDTIQQLMRQQPADLKKPLKIMFQGEEAIDAGGLRKEFFMLLLREIMDPKYGMFKLYEESHLQWFHPETFEEIAMFQLIGCLCGLAIYNATIIQLSFPPALYKKLLKRAPTVDDLKELMPSVGKSIDQMLEYEDNDFEDVFCLTFEVAVEKFGEVKTVELIPGGSHKSVTKENRQEYVDKYVDYIFNKSVEEPFNAFDMGFHKVCGGKVLELFHPQELMAMVVGNENYDFLEFEKNTEYKADYHRYHETIKYFWDVFHDMSLEEKKKFLMFLTGSDRIPIQGMKAVKMVIQPTLEEDYLPVAHTCFNLLDLPKYSNKEKLKKKLHQAIEQTEGFGIV